MFLVRAGQGGNAPVLSLVANEDVQHFVVQSSPQHLCHGLKLQYDIILLVYKKSD